jgi:hypothetical protein
MPDHLDWCGDRDCGDSSHAPMPGPSVAKEWTGFFQHPAGPCPHDFVGMARTLIFGTGPQRLPPLAVLMTCPLCAEVWTYRFDAGSDDA